MDVYIEEGRKRVFAAALEWPGWARSGRDEAAALEALVQYAPRYRAAVGRSFAAPRSSNDLVVVERLVGKAGTDFGVPEVPPSVDATTVEARELGRLVRILRACWTTFEQTADGASGASLRAGPRGGGRDLDKMRAHVLEGQASYLQAVGVSARDIRDWAELKEAFVAALEARARGELPDTGPRGGKRWSARYAVRRAAWHALDHAWEIEDRLEPPATET